MSGSEAGKSVDLTALCAEWQERLGLRDWRISVVPAEVYDMGKHSRVATVEVDLCERVAQIQIMRSDHPALAKMLVRYGDEESLCHELIHVLLEGQPQPENDSQNTLREQAINQLARTLVGLKRAATEVKEGVSS